MTLCQSHYRADMDPHAYSGEPQHVTPIRLDLAEAFAYLARAVDYANSHFASDQLISAENLRDLATWANDTAQAVESEVKEATE